MRFSLAALLLFGVSSVADGQILLDQGWTEDEIDKFYFTPQGSHLIPYKWFLALEQAGNSEPFRSDKNMRSYGILPSATTKRNPDGLPVGFVRDGVERPPTNPALMTDALKASRSIQVDQTKANIKASYFGPKFDEKLYPRESNAWFGLTCAACHTHEIEYGGHTIRIEGGSTQADYESFLRDLGLALRATFNDPAKLERLRIAVGRTGQGGNFRKEVEQVSNAVNELVARNKAKHPYGYARLDAFGAIFNAVCETALGIRANRRPSNAPVSYPSVWNTPKQSWVQWGASADWAEARNVGEVLGVFGAYTITPGDKQFDSTVRLENLVKLEHELIAKLRAPDWPEQQLGKLDRGKVNQGRVLFEKNCQSCHPIRNPNGQFKLTNCGKIPVFRANVGTDMQFLRNLAPSDLVDTGELKPLLGGVDKAPRSEIVSLAVRGIMIKRAGIERVNLNEPPVKRQPQPQPQPDAVGYISRPLEGIWATAPYFHNGSVPNLYETLLPSSRDEGDTDPIRSTEFWVGSRKFDPKHVGFDTTEDELGSMFRVTDENGVPIPGNSNVGHEGHGRSESEGFTQTFENGKWRDFTDKERWALVEYMKSLSSFPQTLVGNLEHVPDGEQKQIQSIIRLTTQRMRKQYTGERLRRGVHPKDHGCVTAKFKVNDDLPKKYRVGVFQPGAEYEAFIRFSNADIRIREDSPRSETGEVGHGSRGMAIKLLGVKGKSLLPLHGTLTQDFLMVNQPSFAFANVNDYDVFTQSDGARDFIQRQVATGDPTTIKRAQVTGAIAQRIRATDVDGDKGAFEAPPASPVDNSYFAAAPFLFGRGRVMKYRARPVKRSDEEPKVNDENYLRAALIERLKKEDVVFEFGLQVRNKEQLNIQVDIENASTVWDDEYVTVATITIPKQNFDSPEQREFCERLFFTPWHGIKVHQPIGGINRLRKAVYLASGKFRSLPKEPASLTP